MGGEIWKQYRERMIGKRQREEEVEKRKREHRGTHGESYPLKLLNYSSNSARWSGLRNHHGNNTTTRRVGYPCPDPVHLLIHTHTRSLFCT